MNKIYVEYKGQFLARSGKESHLFRTVQSILKEDYNSLGDEMMGTFTRLACSGEWKYTKKEHVQGLVLKLDAVPMAKAYWVEGRTEVRNNRKEE